MYNIFMNFSLFGSKNVLSFTRFGLEWIANG